MKRVIVIHLLLLLIFEISLCSSNQTIVTSVSSTTESNNVSTTPRQGPALQCSKENEKKAGYNDTCAYVRNVPTCIPIEGFINYNAATFCDLPRILGIILWGLWMPYLFVALGVVCDDFLCQNLGTVSKHMRLPENVAGVTLLAFGNGAADIFAAVATVTAASGKADSRLAIGSIFGAGVFVTSFVVAVIGYIQPFTVMNRPFMRDIFITMIGVTYVLVIMIRGTMYLWESIIFIGMYVIYVLIVIFSRFIYTCRLRNIGWHHHVRRLSEANSVEGDLDKSERAEAVKNAVMELEERHNSADRERNNNIENNPGKEEISEADIGGSLANTTTGAVASFIVNGDDDGATTVDDDDDVFATNSQFPDIEDDIERPPLRPNKAVKDFLHWAQYVITISHLGRNHPPEIKVALKPRRSFANLLDSVKTSLSRQSSLAELVEDRGPPITEQLKEGLYPFSENFGELSVIGKIFEIIKAPIIFLFSITCPVVELGQRDHNWNKSLIVFQTTFMPLTLTILLKQWAFELLGGVFPVGIISLLIGIALAALVFFTSQTVDPPSYHWVFAYAGFIISVIWIYAIATEIVNVLRMFGLLSGVSFTILGLTFLAWGNSIGDVVANVVMAKQGFSRMSVAACFGAPIMNTFLGLGVPFLIESAKSCGDGSAYSCQTKMEFGDQELVLTVFYFLSLVSSYVIVPLRNYHIDKPYAIYLAILYAVFIIAAILAESGVFNILPK